MRLSTLRDRAQGRVERVIPNSGLTTVCYISIMTIEDLEKAVAKLPADQFAKFRAWFEEFDAARFDRKIARDAKAGKLDRMAEQALDDLRKGRAREL